ncbi:hypothetical protein DY000_02034949 [Brassica cretica]|uniref:Ubiquitin-like protease family profile domain-containing protein n=1 Tax=Brassica cretica TaxID=69181 RepID=A0ABQ7DFZ5_BRACR|nr:hypothetical protein DY000_02034949 [Brassica cretica]
MSEKLKEKVDLEIARVAHEMKHKLKIGIVAMVFVEAIVGIWTSLSYAVSYVPMRALNTSGNDCGAYSLKFIECHLLGLDFSLVNDENIQEARQKIAFDLWEAANDEALQYRMSTFKPPKRAPEKTVELF